MKGYYDKKLSAGRLKKCYEIAPPRVRQYFAAELDHVLSIIKPGDRVLDLGCGYGRIMPALAQKAGLTIGIDNSESSLMLAQETIAGHARCRLALMDAVQLAFREKSFDVVICIQNGISAFHVDQRTLIKETIRVVRPGGTVLFSSYADKFWEHRMTWFQMQAEENLLGEIDYEKTGAGVIVCKDGFKAFTIGPDRFLELTSGFGAVVRILEIDESSIFCELRPGKLHLELRNNSGCVKTFLTFIT